MIQYHRRRRRKPDRVSAWPVAVGGRWTISGDEESTDAALQAGAVTRFEWSRAQNRVGNPMAESTASAQNTMAR